MNNDPASTVGTTSTYKSILGMSKSKTSKVVGLNPNMRPSCTASYAKIFPMYGLWSDAKIFQSTKDNMSVPLSVLEEEARKTDLSHFK